MKVKMHGNTLLITSVFLVAICIFSAGIMGYCVYSAKNNANINEVLVNKNNIKNELNETYRKLLNNEKFSSSEVLTIHESLQSLNDGEKYAYSSSPYSYSFTYRDSQSLYEVNITDNKNNLYCDLMYSKLEGTYSLSEVVLS